MIVIMLIITLSFLADCCGSYWPAAAEPGVPASLCRVRLARARYFAARHGAQGSLPLSTPSRTPARRRLAFFAFVMPIHGAAALPHYCSIDDDLPVRPWDYCRDD